MHFVRTARRFVILAFVFSLTSCGLPADEIVDSAVSDTAEIENTVTVALQETQPATDVPTQPDTTTQILAPTSTAVSAVLMSTDVICENLGTHTYCLPVC